eukprot:CAMPEP_0177648848 /NCGR_PEP_ID=MMETSP0447-20121125/11050_1 /TAXON_ID=0 /ORGANISM="Stygamoeba regulata, Strain BSH-02190019" /LENGTH=116 /DNA_ID=CAMNT_0019151523 /DNA_START=107 /DNA_END=457 /DNA_ORIENTATION=-
MAALANMIPKDIRFKVKDWRVKGIVMEKPCKLSKTMSVKHDFEPSVNVQQAFQFLAKEEAQTFSVYFETDAALHFIAGIYCDFDDVTDNTARNENATKAGEPVSSDEDEEADGVDG